MFRPVHKLSWRVLPLLAPLVLIACSSVQSTMPDFEPRDRTDAARAKERGTIHGSDGIVLLSNQPSRTEDNSGGGGGGGLGVNAYLWRASLDTLDFIPLASADPFGGLIITEWYQPKETPNERFKVNVQIRDQALRADGVKVSAYRQTRGKGDSWIDETVDKTVATQIEDKILTRARELRIETANKSG
jgi:Domain of unknown function (DUF3576)